MPLPEKTVSVNINGSSLPVQYWESGEHHGRAILLLHGDVGSALVHWGETLSALGDTFHVLAPNLPAFGGSAALPNANPDSSDYCQWLIAFLDALNINQAVIVGNESGGLLARLFAAEYPQRVPALILVNGGGIATKPSVADRLLARIPMLGQTLIYASCRSQTTRPKIEALVHEPQIITDEFAEAAKANLAGLVGLVRAFRFGELPAQRTPIVPTLLLWGTEDKSAPLKEAEVVRASIPGSELSPISGVGHFPHLEAPDVFTWQVEQFLERLTRPQRSKVGGASVLRPLQ
ncbi:MAG: alpha/beta hydrolase [Burkholderiales bacterium]|nr:alpha/beta hydrolase [Anaerolineae bacterium]